jgi:hypothetical protein
MTGLYLSVSTRLYRWLLLAYPSHFRRRFGDEMLQTFRDCSYFESNLGSLIGFWFRTLFDLVVTAARERTDNSGREGAFMNNMRRDALALLACVGIIVVALVLHRYAIRNQVSFILAFGYALDALIVTGVVGNLIIFLLTKTTKLKPLRTAFVTFAVVHVLLFLLGFVLARNDPGLNVNGVVLGYVVSFLFWTTLHLVWWRRKDRLTQQEQV